MSSNDTEYLLNQDFFDNDIAVEEELSTEYLLNHSFAPAVASDDNLQQYSKKPEKVMVPNLSKPNEDIENILNNQDASIIQTHSAIHSLIDNYANNGQFNILKTVNMGQEILETFLKIFENYCYFIRYYEYQLYIANQDKYIRFLSNMFAGNNLDSLQVGEDLNMFIEIIYTFVNEPTNIYMRLSKNLLEKNNKLRSLILNKWSGRYKIYKTSNLVTHDANEEIKKTAFLSMVKKARNIEHELMNKLNQHLLDHSIQNSFDLWREKCNLADHYAHFGNELIKERILKKSIQEKWSLTLIHRNSATDFMNKSLKKRVFAKLIVCKKNANIYDTKQKAFADRNLKQKTMSNLKEQYTSISTLDSESNMNLQKNILDRLLKQSKLLRQADVQYFNSLKKHHWELLQKKLTLSLLERKYKENRMSKYLKTLQVRVNELGKLQRLGKSERKMLLKRSLMVALKHSYNHDKELKSAADKKALAIKSAMKPAFNKWRVMVENIKNEKLIFYERIYTNEVAVPVAREFVFRALLSSYNSLRENSQEANRLHTVNSKKRFVDIAKQKLKGQDELLSEATNYRSTNVKEVYLDKWKMSSYVAESHDELMLAFLNKKMITELGRILYNWNLKVMRNESMNTPLLTHRKRWRRAQLRGALEIWVEKLRLKEAEIAKQTIKTPFRLHQTQKAYSGTVDRSQIPQRFMLDETLFTETPPSQNVYSSEFKSSKIREKKELLGNFTPYSKFSKDLLKPSPVKKQTLRTRLENSSNTKDEFNTNDYLLSNSGPKNKINFRNRGLEDTTFSTPVSTSSKLSHRKPSLAHGGMNLNENKGGSLPRLK